MNQYEIAVIYDPGFELDLDKATSKVEKLIADAGGKVISNDNWGKRKLAYPIQKQDYGIYVFYTVEMPANAPAKLERDLNIADEVIRFLVTRPDLKKQAKAEAERAEKAAKAAERGESESSESSDKEE